MDNPKNNPNKKTDISWKKMAIYMLAFSLFLAIFISPFASSSPDGLEKVAETNSFIEKAKDNNFSLAKDYKIPMVSNSFTSTALSGFMGTIFLFSSVWFIFSFIPKKRKG
jgi:cobalt/nickel transport protein